MSLDLIGKILIKTEVVTNDQWQAAVKASGKLDGVLAQLRKVPAWWHPQSPALSSYQMERIRDRAENGLRDLDRDLRIGRYLKLQRLGKGGMAEVFEAWSLDLREVVALKLLLGEGSVLWSRQRREADALKSLNHPNIARFRPFEEPSAQESAGILAMDFVPGADFKETVLTGGTIAPATVAKWAVALLEALARAYEQKLVHRDIKPGYIRVMRNGAGVKLLDFGLARQTDCGDQLTKTREALGTPHYMAPEQFEGGSEATWASDIYSLGCTLYYMLAGKPPFDEPSLPGLILAHVNRRPQRLRVINAEIPADLDTAILRMLAKSPSERGTHEELISWFKRIEKGEPLPEPIVEAAPVRPFSSHGDIDGDEYRIEESPYRGMSVATPVRPKLATPKRIAAPQPTAEMRPVRSREIPLTSWKSDLWPATPLMKAARMIDPTPSLAEWLCFDAKARNVVLTASGIGLVVAGIGIASLIMK